MNTHSCACVLVSRVSSLARHFCFLVNIWFFRTCALLVLQCFELAGHMSYSRRSQHPALDLQHSSILRQLLRALTPGYRGPVVCGVLWEHFFFFLAYFWPRGRTCTETQVNDTPATHSPPQGREATYGWSKTNLTLNNRTLTEDRPRRPLSTSQVVATALPFQCSGGETNLRNFALVLEISRCLIDVKVK